MGFSFVVSFIDDEELERLTTVGASVGVFVQGLEPLISFGDIDVASVMGGIAEGMSGLFDVLGGGLFSDAPIEELSLVSTAMKDLFGSIGSVDLSGMSGVFESLTFIASDEFVTGIDAATSAIWELVGALGVLSLLSGLMSIFGGGEDKPVPPAQQTIPQPSVGHDLLNQQQAPLSEIPPEEMLSPEEMGEFGGLSLETLGVEAANVVINMPAPVPGESVELGGGLEAKLDEMINLMRSGGIAVNLDGKKVNRELATAIEG